MKIIHTADLHLDSKLNTHFGNHKEKMALRRQELLGSFRRLVKYATDQGIKEVIIAGDMFDSRVITKTTENVVLGEIRDHADISFYYLNGNHDEESFLLSLQEKPANLYTFGTDWVEYRLSDKVSLYGAELTSDSYLYSSLVTDHQRINIVTLHGQDNQYSAKDKAEIINLSALKNKGIDYLALGHIHTYKRERLDSRGVYCYPGCLEGRGFDETGEKGFVLLDIDEEKGTINDTFIPFASRCIHRLEIDVTGLSTTLQAEDKIRLVLNERDIPAKDMVEIILTGNVSMEAEFNELAIELNLGDDYFFFRVKNCTAILIDYKSYELDETLKGEFVRIVSAAAELSEEEKNNIIKTGIGLLTGNPL